MPFCMVSSIINEKSWKADKYKLSCSQAQGLAFPVSLVDKENIKCYKNGLSSAPFRFSQLVLERGLALSPQNNIVKNGGSLFSSSGLLWVLRVFVFKTPLYQCFMENREREKVAAPGLPLLKFLQVTQSPLASGQVMYNWLETLADISVVIFLISFFLPWHITGLVFFPLNGSADLWQY